MEIYNWLSENIKTNQFFNTAIFVSIAGVFFAYLKNVPKSIWELIVNKCMYNVIVYETDPLYVYIIEWLKENYKDKPTNVEYVTILESTNYIDIDENNFKKIIEIPIQNYFYLRYSKRLLKISFSREKIENANSLKSLYLKHFTIKGFFASKSIKSLMEDINKKYSDKKKDPKLYISSIYGDWDNLSTISGKSISDVIINKKLKTEIIKDINTWKVSKDEYIQRGIAYKRGHCYYGPPGTGKTTLVKAIAIEYKMDIFCINLNKVDSDYSLLRLLSRIQPNSILLFEDIDAYFNKRELVNSDSKLTFSALLNGLDGVANLNNIFIIFTTNHIEKLDPALIRPGRIDLVKEIKHATSIEISEYISMFYGIDLAIKIKNNLPMSVVQNICLSNPTDYKKTIDLITNKQE